MYSIVYRTARAAVLPVAALIGIAVLGGGVGCKTVNTVSRAAPTAAPDVVRDKRVVTDAFLDNKVRVLQVRQAQVSGDILKVQVEVYNDDTWAGNFTYRFEWFDDQGMIVESPLSVWKSRPIEPKETVSLVGVAPDPRCKDFRLKLERAR